MNPIGERACYDEGKRCAEALVFSHRRHYGTDTRVARIFNTYGPGMRPDDGRVVSNFIVQALQGRPFTLYGDGRQTRSFCYVSDLVDGLVRLMRCPADPGPVNLGNPDEITVRELGERIARLLGVPARFEHRPLPSDDPTRRPPDITRARQVLDWRPRVPLGEGLARTIAWFRERHGAPRLEAVAASDMGAQP